MAHNNEFKQACEAWLKAALSLLNNKPVPLTQDLQVTFIPDGWKTQGSLKPDYQMLYVRYEEALLNLREVDALTNSIVKLPPPQASFDFIGTIEQVDSNPDGLKKWLIGLYLNKFLVVYLNSNNAFTFIPAEFERIYQKLEYYLYNNGPFAALWLIDFSDLMLEIDKLILGDGIYLRQTTEAEKEHVIKGSSASINALRPIEVPKAFLEIHHDINKFAFPDQQMATHIGQAVLLALRLIKATPIGIGKYQWGIPDQPFWPFQGHPLLDQISNLMFHSSNFQHHPTVAGDRYIFTQEDAQILPKLFRKARKALANSKLRTAITRFEDSYSKTKMEDKLIDYWTALEALFFLEDEFQDMGKSLALAASYYLGQNSMERTTIYNDLTRSHTLRSHYIHGERKKAKHPLDEMVAKTGSYLRSALYKRIEENEN
ncbi:hypothetical protein KSC_063160 [Ktedonobacter sp. SOSP1-52]|uniref:HEPN domain-containing protein n=1 Tax=Ktedonobacter sp. SOSP1-52 TaxID=2778366 RepID=UPI0019168820|nr:HEPN domain-containing protein [Ktedonobacter sp. SOSP1-52]GHO67424.1 hypothetical protein KSC_063160 [Ktedonobacter sp. SOSP1-52]